MMMGVDNSTATSSATIMPMPITTNADNSSTTTLSLHSIEYVPVDDTIADVALTQKASAGLSTSISVLMSFLVCASFFMNSALFATILSSYKLRRSLLYMLFCILTLLNLFDVLLIMLISLLCVANGGQWIFGNFVCRLNAFAQQFVLLATLLTLTLMAVERALSLIGRHLVTIKFFGVLSLLFTVIPGCFGTALFLPGFPVSVFPFRYLCAISSESPILYSVAQLLVYGGCIFVLILCLVSILKHKRIERTLPSSVKDYGAFIMQSRAIEDHMNLSRVVLLLTIEYFAIEGPYIGLDFFVQIRNSIEMLNRWGTDEMEVPQDADTLITIIKLFHPIFAPMIIFASCPDIWTKFVNLMCCRRNPGGGHMPNSWGTHPNCDDHEVAHSNVMTLYATPEGGLQLRLPNEVIAHPSLGIHSSTVAAQNNNPQEEEEEEGEEEGDETITERSESSSTGSQPEYSQTMASPSEGIGIGRRVGPIKGSRRKRSKKRDGQHSHRHAWK